MQGTLNYGAADRGKYRYHLMPPLLVLGGLQHLAGLGVDQMNLPASDTRHGFVKFVICCAISSTPALHLHTSSWATVNEGNNHLPAIWETAPLEALLISANVLITWATFACDEARRIVANIAKLPDLLQKA